MSAIPKSRRNKANYVTQVMVVSLLLFVLALFANIIYHSYIYSKELKSMQYLRIELKDNANAEQVKSDLIKSKVIKELVFISKDEGLELVKANTSVDASTLLDSNPLPNLYNAFLQSGASPAEIDREVEQIAQIAGIASVGYKSNDTKLLDKLIRNISWVMLALISILLLVAIYIIDSTVRLALFSKRMTIRSMQLIGATRGFIRKPYIVKAVVNGFISGMIALFLIAGIYALMEAYYPALNLLQEVVSIAMISTAILLIGIIFTLISTFFSLRKYLRMKLDDLY